MLQGSADGVHQFWNVATIRLRPHKANGNLERNFRRCQGRARRRRQHTTTRPVLRSFPTDAADGRARAPICALRAARASADPRPQTEGVILGLFGYLDFLDPGSEREALGIRLGLLALYIPYTSCENPPALRSLTYLYTVYLLHAHVTSATPSFANLTERTMLGGRRRSLLLLLPAVQNHSYSLRISHMPQ